MEEGCGNHDHLADHIAQREVRRWRGETYHFQLFGMKTLFEEEPSSSSSPDATLGPHMEGSGPSKPYGFEGPKRCERSVWEDPRTEKGEADPIGHLKQLPRT